LTSAIRRRPRYGLGPNVAWVGRFRKGRGTPVGLMNIRPPCPVQGGFPLFCRDNAVVLNLADAGLSSNRGADEAFLRPRGRSCRAARGAIVFAAGRYGFDEVRILPVARTIGLAGKSTDDGQGYNPTLSCANRAFMLFRMNRDTIRFRPRLSEALIALTVDLVRLVRIEGAIR
jgi:hypothetical protein